MIPDSFERMTYVDDDARMFRLSDHCPVAVWVTSEEVKR